MPGGLAGYWVDFEDSPRSRLVVVVPTVGVIVGVNVLFFLISQKGCLAGAEIMLGWREGMLDEPNPKYQWQDLSRKICSMWTELVCYLG